MSKNITETEITTPVDLCTPTGHLNRSAIGWTRHPLHNTDRIGQGCLGYGRNKRWEYWNVMTPQHIIALTISALDYLSLSAITIIDRQTQMAIENMVLKPGSQGVKLPGTLGKSPAEARYKNLAILLEDIPEGTRLRAKTPQLKLDIKALRPSDQECLGVVVPWNQRLFQYTVKDVARPAAGKISISGVDFPVPSGESWAVLDHGRGRWPYSMIWNWGAGSGLVDGKRLGVQLGGKWTDGTGSTENALFVAGRAHKISEEVVWEYDISQPLKPWRVVGDRVDITLDPFYDRVTRTNAGIIASSGHQVFGIFSGWISDETGQEVSITGIEGWLEEIRNRW